MPVGLTPLELASWVLVFLVGVLPACATIWALGGILTRMAKAKGTNKSGNKRGKDHSTTKPVRSTDGRLKKNGGGKS